MYSERTMSRAERNELENAAKPRKWLFRAVLGNAALGFIQVATGISTGSNTLVSEGVHNTLDSAGYSLNHRAAGHENKGQSTYSKRVNRLAGYLICVGAAMVMVEAGQDLYVGEQPHDPNGFEQAAMYSGAGLNIAVATGLRPHAHNGGAHRMGWLHAASDISGSVINGIGMFLSVRGVAQADQLAAIASSAVYVAFNYPTKSRISHNQ